MYMFLCLHVGLCARVLLETRGIGVFGAGVTYSCEQSDANQIQVLCKSCWAISLATFFASHFVDVYIECIVHVSNVEDNIL